jgi:hypothetical protein
MWKKNHDSSSPQVSGGNSNCRGGRRNHCHRWNNAANALSGKLKGKTQGIENNILGKTGPHNVANFHWSFKHIADHLKLILGNEVLEAIRMMTPVTINIPAATTPQPDPINANGLPIPVSEIDTYLWKEKH